jgi:hypothetical protein
MDAIALLLCAAQHRGTNEIASDAAFTSDQG